MPDTRPQPERLPEPRILPPAEALLAAESGGGTPCERAAPERIRKGTPAFRRIAFAMLAAGFATFALLYAVQPLMPIFAREFSLHAASSSLVLSISTGLLAGGLILTGPLSDAVGRRPVMMIALFGSALGTLGSAVMPTWHGVLFMRAIIGLSLSGLVAVAMTYLSEEIHPEVLGWSMGLYISGNALGGMLGRLIVGVIVDFVSWRVALGVLGGLGLIAALLFARLAPASRHFRPTPLHWAHLRAGFALHLRDGALPWLFAEGFLLMGGFVTLFNYISYRLLAPPYLLSQAIVGCISAVYLIGMYSSARVGALADKLGRRRVLWVVTATMLAGVLVTLARPLPVVLLGMLIFTFGFFGAHSVASSWIGRRARQARGQASSLYLLAYYLGGSIAGTLGGYWWHLAGWPGVALFIAALLLAALLVAVRLIRVPPLTAA
ncbi:MFS transporter [Opitutus sp. ER46]|uniref:MFS transporter n=1 Tax=Opitutus sp. ER46 TaxID=2161864 RepID=UPI000D31B1F1|nr:MFS transporter [Opitutus sp. ER46]PTX97753.1 MFS transporter [Opitutus sp. ER46]